jgi:hypothetical protein
VTLDSAELVVNEFSPMAETFLSVKQSPSNITIDSDGSDAFETGNAGLNKMNPTNAIVVNAIASFFMFYSSLFSGHFGTRIGYGTVLII